MPYYIAMMEAMDFEIGRLLVSMSQSERDNTVVIFIGDNGTPKWSCPISFRSANSQRKFVSRGDQYSDDHLRSRYFQKKMNEIAL